MQQNGHQKERYDVCGSLREKVVKNRCIGRPQQKQLLASVPYDSDLEALESPLNEDESEPATFTPKKEMRSLWEWIWNKEKYCIFRNLKREFEGENFFFYDYQIHYLVSYYLLFAFN